MDYSRVSLNPDTGGPEDASAKSQGKLALVLGVIAIALSLVLGFVYLISVRRLEGELARLSQQTEGLNRLVERAQEQSQKSAQQASEAAANARAAAEQRDSANQAQLNSEAQAQLARQQAVAEQQKADQATQQAEEYRQERESELQQLQQALGQIAETRRTASQSASTLIGQILNRNTATSSIASPGS
jgi:DNA anti-recombination protein RmuC